MNRVTSLEYLESRVNQNPFVYIRDEVLIDQQRDVLNVFWDFLYSAYLMLEP
jgi:hypothetical protein